MKIWELSDFPSDKLAAESEILLLQSLARNIQCLMLQMHSFGNIDMHEICALRLLNCCHMNKITF